jgi:hypothetical protein
MSVITLSKLEAGSRQLRTAISLWFEEADPVSTHALAFAAYEIFDAVSLHRDPHRRDLLFDSDWIKDEFRRDWNKHIRREANFFKHGNRDPEEAIEFNPDLTEWFILFATYARGLCREPQSEEETLFTWTLSRRKGASLLATAFQLNTWRTSGHSADASFEKHGAKLAFLKSAPSLKSSDA